MLNIKRVSYPYIVCVKYFVRFISRIVLSVWQIYFGFLCVSCFDYREILWGTIAVGFAVILKNLITLLQLFKFKSQSFLCYFVTFFSYIYTFTHTQKEFASLSGKFLCLTKDYFSWDTLMVTMVIYRQLVATW